MTTLSVLVPHYNDPQGFELVAKSIERQTWQGSREIIVVDDGSDPEHLARLEEIVDSSPEQIRLIRNRTNRGRPYTRNVLLDAADGKYTTWCDSGDEFYPTKIQAQLEGLYRARALELEDPIWCTCNYDWKWQSSRLRHHRRQNVEGDQLTNLFLSTLRAYLFTLLGTTQSFKDVGYFDGNLPRLQDLDFFIRFLAKGGQFVLPVADEPLCVYFKTDVGRKGEEVLRCQKHIYRKHSALLMTRSRKFRRQRQFDMYMLAARYTFNNDDLLRSGLYMGASVLYNPLSFAKRMIKNRGRP